MSFNWYLKGINESCTCLGKESNILKHKICFYKVEFETNVKDNEKITDLGAILLLKSCENLVF